MVDYAALVHPTSDIRCVPVIFASFLKGVPGKTDPEPQQPFLDAYAQLKQKNRKSGFAGSIRLVHHCGSWGAVPGYADFSRHPGEGGLQSGAGTQSNGLGISATLH